LSSQLSPADRVVVSDSASTDPRVAALARRTGACVLRSDTPGTSRARNVGWRAATTEIVAFVDDDVRVEAGWTDALAAVFADPATAFAVGRLTAIGNRGEVTSTVTSVETAELVTFPVRSVVSGGNLAVRREALVATGGFDERIGPGTWFAAGEDAELVDRLVELGFSGRYVGDAAARHEQWRDRGALLRLQWCYGKGMGARTAAAMRRGSGHPGFGELIRLRGLRSLMLRPSPVAAATSASWLGPLLWRAGALLGWAVGLLRLSPRTLPSRRS
jgi:GT2 family glycosyltransferase